MCAVLVCRTLVGGMLGFHWYSFSVAICLHTPAHHHHWHTLSSYFPPWKICGRLIFFLLTCLTKSCNREGIASLSDWWILRTNQHTSYKDKICNSSIRVQLKQWLFKPFIKDLFVMTSLIDRWVSVLLPRATAPDACHLLDYFWIQLRWQWSSSLRNLWVT